MPFYIDLASVKYEPFGLVIEAGSIQESMRIAEAFTQGAALGSLTLLIERVSRSKTRGLAYYPLDANTLFAGLKRKESKT